MEVKVGFIGAGKIAHRHMEKLSKIKDVRLNSFCDIEEIRAREAMRKYGGTYYTEYHQMLEKEDLDAVYICLPPFAHTDQEILAAESGINLFVEKPIALNLEKVHQIKEVVEKNGIITSVGYLYRYADIVNRAKEILAHKKVAMFLGYYFCPIPLLHWWGTRHRSGGQIVEQTTHIFDLARYLIGEVDEIYGQRIRGLRDGKSKNCDIDDASCITLHFQSGAIGNISSSCLLSHGRDWGADLVTPDMRIQLHLSSHLLKISNEKEEEMKMQIDPYELEDRAFIQAVKEGNPEKIKSSYADALRTLELTLAANSALDKGRIISL